MRSEYASSPTRGSRFVGLLSMIITSALGSGLPLQERRGRNEKRTERVRAVLMHARTHPSKTAKGGAPTHSTRTHAAIAVLGSGPAARCSRIRNRSEERRVGKE